MILLHITHFIHPGGCEENPHVSCEALQLSVLRMTELQVALVFPVCASPRVRRGVRALERAPGESVLELALLKFHAVCTTALREGGDGDGEGLSSYKAELISDSHLVKKRHAQCEGRNRYKRWSELSSRMKWSLELVFSPSRWWSDGHVSLQARHGAWLSACSYIIERIKGKN